MIILKIRDTEINYIQYGNEHGKDIVLLHGWCQNIEMMDPIGRRLQDDFRITIIDLPGFGKSPEPPYAWTLNDYEEAVEELLSKLKIKKPIMIGHSFGGSISIVYASMNPTTKLILFAPRLRSTNKKATFKVKLLKFMKRIPLINKLEGYMKTKIGSRDYRNATPLMRKVLVNVVNENLTSKIHNIKCSTLLIWGSNDTEVPFSEGKYIESIIKDCGLIIYDGCSHYAYLERLDQTINVLNEFLKNEKEVV